MKNNPIKRYAIWLLVLVLTAPYASNSNQVENADLPANSVYHLDVTLENQSGEMIGLDHFQGQPTLVTMFYANCPHVCPLLISTIKVTEARLSEQERQQLRVLTISIDPKRDTPAVLLEMRRRHAVDADRWEMVRPEPTALRSIAGIFGIRYKELPDGEFNHSTKLILLDRYGTPIAETDRLGRHDPEFLLAIQAAIK